jgi:hypothetical protein
MKFLRGGTNGIDFVNIKAYFKFLTCSFFVEDFQFGIIQKIN